MAGAARVAAYHPVGSEIDPRAAFEGTAPPLLPCFAPGEDRFSFRAGDPVGTGPNGIPQPHHDAAASIPDLVLVPLLGCDPGGQRLGQGGGHYDSVLPGLRKAGATLIGVGWALQRLPFPLPVEPWDVPLDGFASPEGLEMFR